MITVSAPYYDPDGEALAEFSRRFPLPVRTLLQKNHVGLSDNAASTLPENIELQSVDIDPSRFIHAKFYCFQSPASSLLFVGSANVSRAALLANEGWGNAELMAVQTLTNEQTDELLSSIVVLSEPPDFPENPPSDEWEVLTNPLRITSARYENGVLDIAFRTESDISRMLVEMDGESTQPWADFKDNSNFRIRIGKCPKTIRLLCTTKTGEELTSEPSWVDNENSLGISVPERRISAKLAEAAETGSLSASGMFEILQLLHQHLQQPVKQTTFSRSAADETKPQRSQSYNVEDVFSDGFGRPRTDTASALPAGFRESDFLNAFSAYFTTAEPEVSNGFEAGSSEEAATDEHRSEGHEQDEVGTDKTKQELEQHQARQKRAEESERLRKKLLGALENVISAMSDADFVSSRPPERLGADIAATALLLRKGLSDKIITEDDFAEVTKRLWIVLFFGSKDAPSVIQQHLETCSTTEKTDFEATVSSPRLTAALTLWCFPDWGSDSTEAIQFKFSAMLLAGKMPWIVNGGTIDEIHGELRRLARAIPGSASFETLVTAWANWIQAGIAFREFERAVSVWSPKELAELIDVDSVNRGDLLWQAGQFCVSHADYRRDPKTKAIVHPLARYVESKIIGSWLVPVSKLLGENDLLGIDMGPRVLLRRIVTETSRISLGTKK